MPFPPLAYTMPSTLCNVASNPNFNRGGTSLLASLPGSESFSLCCLPHLGWNSEQRLFLSVHLHSKTRRGEKSISSRPLFWDLVWPSSVPCQLILERVIDGSQFPPRCGPGASRNSPAPASQTRSLLIHARSVCGFFF